MDESRFVEFNALPPDIRRRLVESFDDGGEPAPLLADRSSLAMTVAGWLAVSAGGLALLALSLWWGFGDLHDDFAVQAWWAAPVYVGGVFLVGWGGLRAARRAVLARCLPYTPGRYLLPVDFIDARTDRLRVVPRSEMFAFNGVHHHKNGSYTHTELNLRFPHGLETFTIHGLRIAEHALDEMRSSLIEVQQAVQTNDLGALADLDPLLEPRLSDGWEALTKAPSQLPSSGPVARRLPAVFGFSAILAGILGVLAGPPLELARNLVSDELMISELRTGASTWDVDGYVAHGWRHQDEVEELAIVAELRDAKASRTVAPLRAFVAAHPDHPLAADARAKEHELYGDALAAFERQAVNPDPAVVPFVRALLAWLEAHDSAKVLVRFDPPSAEALKLVDQLVGSLGGKLDGHEVAPIAPYFDDVRSQVREKAIVDMMEQGFQKVFPNDVLMLELGPRLGPDDADVAATVPTIRVAYDVGPSGSVYSLDGTTRTYVGITVGFDVQMQVPDHEETIGFQLDVAPPQTFDVSTFSGLGLHLDPTDDSVYQVMALRAFDQLGTKVKAVFFEPPPPEPTDDDELPPSE